MSYFDSLQLLPEDPIFSIPRLFAADPRPNKVNLGVGNYRDAEGASYVLDCVRDAEAALLLKKSNKDYLPIDGDQKLLNLTKPLIFGQKYLDSLDGGLFITQTLGGTGALFQGGQFLCQTISKDIYIPDVTWPNHKQVFNNCGFDVHQYRYYDHRSHKIDFNRLCDDLSEMPQYSTILLHACCQNPTGLDPTNDQWMELSTLIKKQKIIPFFDFAYQGFKTSPEDDAFPIRYFLSQGHELLVANSFAKNFGLYGERVGTLSVLTKNKNSAPKAASLIKQRIRSNYSNPPRHGAELIAEILASYELTKTWVTELANMRDRLKEMRHTLQAGLQAKGDGMDWTFLKNQFGFFSFCGLNHGQVHRLIKDYAIYVPANGRINVAGLNAHNMDYVVDAILEVIHT